MLDDPAVHGDLSGLYDRAQLSSDSKDYLSRAGLLAELERVAKAGWENAARALANELAKPGSNRDAEQAYKWYHIAFAWDDYETSWNNQNDEDDVYLGVAGDFRNESVVSELVDEITHSRLRELDAEAMAWLSLHDRQE